MLIQFDREDSENLVLTFDNSEEDAEQMQDFIAWLEASGLEFNKLKMKIPGVSEKVTNLFVKKQVVHVTPTPTSVSTGTTTKSVSQSKTQVQNQDQNQVLEEEGEDTETAHIMANDVSSESDSESETDAEPVSKTKKTTKRTTKVTK